MKRKFKYVPSNIDMKSLYNKLTIEHKEFPEIKVFEQLEDKNDISCHIMPNGRYIIYLKNDSNMTNCLLDTLKNPNCKCYPAFPHEYHNIDCRNICKWITCAIVISNILRTRCPQILFTKYEDAFNFTGQGLLLLPDFYSDIDMFNALAHELRHEWQYFTHPEWKEDYVMVNSEKDIPAYYNHISEIDAEAFARKLTSIVYGVDALNVDLQNGENLSAILDRAEEINILISDGFCQTNDDFLMTEDMLGYLRSILLCDFEAFE